MHRAPADALPHTDEPARGRGDHDRPRLTGLRILVADDVDTNRDILDVLLSQENAEVHCAEDGKRAIQLQKPGDIEMPSSRTATPA